MQLEQFVIDQLWILAKIGIAMILGAIIGFEREASEKPAGLRTHMLVSGASAFIIAMGQVIEGQFISIFGEAYIRSDPLRIIQGVVTGISFLGAGIIIREARQQNVRYLTTAASLYFVAVVGISIALSQWVTGFGSVVLVLVILRIFPLLERFLLNRDRRRKQQKDKKGG
ncbi:MAG: MgtC/SapB family protein [Aliifodinibius sp.]|nr:MgtC/SapB family protein [candidate division Zixibacteria bacterium]NIT55565.1 MgtC/SapB family protein [Fodinibius sp.]NIW43815.1 MgtC/SapB family protein [Gammaproteobacteria bacterium]NIS44956.1 MgtC/SapB family protein [candidate division Zixibacteria bacterium]NIU13058.1 MgtC/SapB family protein [candidate division Zixibacteria bacterium]